MTILCMETQDVLKISAVAIEYVSRFKIFNVHSVSFIDVNVLKFGHNVQDNAFKHIDLHDTLSKT